MTSGTIEQGETTMTGTAASAGPNETRALYWRLWRRVPRDLAVTLAGWPVALVGFITTVTLFTSGVGSLVTIVGFFVVIAALYVARGFGIAEIAQLEWAGQPKISRPEWQDARARLGFWGWLRSVLGNGHYWLYLLHTMIVSFIVNLVTWALAVIWVAFILGLTFPARWIAGGDPDWLDNSIAGNIFGGRVSTSGLMAIDTAFTIGIALVALVTLPFVLRGLVLVRYWIARGMLSSFKSDALQRQVIDLTLSRGAAQSAEGHSLRRLERDIHDGPQQRLVRQQMDLAAAERQLDVDPAAARALIASAMEQSREALEELRALSRGFAPPILLDRGLVAALESAAVRSTVPTRITDQLLPGTELPQELERNAYFAASEALANAAKHSGATEITITVAIHRNPEADDSWLDVAVADNGRGGALPVAGHGLAGLDERLRGLGGILEVTSPAGGPTVVTAHLPLGSALPSSI